MPTQHLLISGKVQGVFFRASAKEVADQSGIKGWARNTADGKVEIVAMGSEEALAAFIAWCHRGPDAAEVHQVLATTLPDTERFSRFSIRR